MPPRDADLQTLIARQIGRPLLMTPDAAGELAARIWRSEPRAFRSETKFAAFLRLAGMGRPKVFDDDDYAVQSVEDEPMPPGGFAYCPMWMEERGGPDDDLGLGMSLKDGIACLSIDTAIAAKGTEFCGSWWHGYDTIAAALRTAFADERVRGIFIHFDTPGGVVDDGIDEVCEILRANREAAGGKPVWGFCEVAASAGYWIAAQCDRLVAPRTGLVGSIGAVMVHWENSAELAREGIKVTPIQYGAQKTAGASFRPLTDVDLGDMQAWVDQAGRDFLAAITAGRPALTAEACIATEARLYVAHHDEAPRSGLGIGLVDDLMRAPAAFAALAAHTEQAAQAITGPAASAGPGPAPTAEARTGDGSMAKPKAAAPKSRTALQRAAQRKAAEARLAAIRAEEELEALEDEEPAAEGEEEDVAAEGDEEEVAAEDMPEEVTGEGDEEELTAEDEEEMAPAARTKMRKLAIAGLPEARGNEAFARSLADQGLSVAKAQAILRSAQRTSALGRRSDKGPSGAPSATGSKSAAAELVSDLVAATGTSRLRKQKA